MCGWASHWPTGGLRRFLGLSGANPQPHLVFDAMLRAAEIVGMLLDEQDTEVTRVGEHRDELAALLPLLGLERFDRRALNRVLAGLAATQARVA